MAEGAEEWSGGREAGGLQQQATRVARFVD